MRKLESIVFLFCGLSASLSLYSQSDNIGSGRALSLNGISDYVDFGDRYRDLTFPFTISAWTYLDPSNSAPAPIFTNRNCNPIYQGFRLIINSNYISVEYGDGFGGNSPVFRRGKIAYVDGLLGRWNYITAVVKGPSDINLYLNGINVHGSPSGESYNPMVSNLPGGFTSSAYFISNNVIYRYKGAIDEIRFWNIGLSEQEIRKTMCVHLLGNEPGLIGYWDFNETTGNTVVDKSPNKFDGQFVGNPTRVFSGAPIGDVSTFQYSTSWSGTTVSMQDGNHKIDVENIGGAVDGVQLYEVKSLPSQTAGLDLSESNEPYFGVFLISQNSGSTFDANYSYLNHASCKSFSRNDNSNVLWNKVDNPIIDKTERVEFLKATGGNPASLDLGNDKIVCDQSSYSIETGITDPEFSFDWSTGETTSSISVNQSGQYIVRVTGLCGVNKDTVEIDFMKRPLPVSLGQDKQSCIFNPTILQPVSNRGELIFQWQDGSVNPTFEVTEYGKFWVVVKNFCGQESDSITFSQLKNSINLDLGNDKVVCDQPSYLISTGITDPGFSFKWSTGETTSSILVNHTGKYSVTMIGACEVKDTLNIILLNKPAPVSLGEDDQFCTFNPITLRSLEDPSGLEFLWQDGSVNPTFEVTEYGKFWVVVKNFCGQESDSITFSQLKNSINLDLGNDKVVCDQPSYLISTGITDPGFSFKWNTGETSSSILINQTGKYSVTMIGACEVKDTLNIILLNKPAPVSLGEDAQFCAFNPITLRPIEDPSGLEFLWQDGSTDPTFKADSFGEFWLTVKNNCGQESDSIVFSEHKFSTDQIPNVITPNGDELNDFFIVQNEIEGLVSLRVVNRWGDEVYYSPTYKNNWSGGELSSGLYYILLDGACIEKTKSFLQIIK